MQKPQRRPAPHNIQAEQRESLTTSEWQLEEKDSLLRIGMANLGHMLGRGTIRRILKDRGIEPAPRRGKGMPWSVFLKAHWKALVVADFFSVEVWSWQGLTTYHALFVIDLAIRRIHVAGITVHPNAEWMMQIERNLLDVARLGESGRAERDRSTFASGR